MNLRTLIPRRQAPPPSVADLHLILSQAVLQGVISRDEGHMMQRILSLSQAPLAAAMVPKSQMVSVEASAPVAQIIATFLKCGFSRIPVYEENPDNLVGIIHVKELLRLWDRARKNLMAIEFIRLPHFFPQTMKVAQALSEFRKRKISVGIVIDEYGNPVGMVTAEDLIEEIVGEMQDELDHEPDYCRPQPDGTLAVDPNMPLDKFQLLAGVEIRSRARTVAGLVLEELQHIPAPGEKFKLRGLECQVLESTPAKIISLKIRPPHQKK